VGVILKIYFEKAYDKVNLDFFIDCHMARGFFSNGVCGLDIFCIMAQ
jgi:hypothetical protein